jgi:hypothetical protein
MIQAIGFGLTLRANPPFPRRWRALGQLWRGRSIRRLRAPNCSMSIAAAGMAATSFFGAAVRTADSSPATEAAIQQRLDEVSPGLLLADAKKTGRVYLVAGKMDTVYLDRSPIMELLPPELVIEQGTGEVTARITQRWRRAG